ncbi:N-acetyl sugar amidotransferase [Alteromonadales bacterium alter-6D02]|nr:N-acetyl sugar amidotransferase [Alteromonadales bacterium alter-6D02]
MKQHDLRALYNLPEKIVFCKECTISNQRPRITFDQNGVCSACNFAKYKRNKIDWNLREQELRELCDKHRKNDGSYDVIVPVSGGKDGGFVAHMLKYKYGMNPLTVTWSPSLYTDIGRKNLDNFIRMGGFDNVLGSVNGRVHRELSRLSFLHMGDNFQPFIYGQTNFPLKMAVQHNVSLIMYGENGEVEYGGNMKNAHRPTRDIEDHDSHYFSGKPPEFWEEHGIKNKDIYPYLPPKYDKIVENKTEIHFMGYYHFWDPQENFYYCTEHNGFEINPERSEGTYSKYASLDDKTDWLHYHLAFIKFGIGRATSDTAHEIRDHKITREEGIALVKKYDSEQPKKHFKETLDYLNVSEEQYHEIIDSWRSPHIWKKENGQWVLKNAIWYK